MKSHACYDYVVIYFVWNYETHAKKYVVKRCISLHVFVWCYVVVLITCLGSMIGGILWLELLKLNTKMNT